MNRGVALQFPIRACAGFAIQVPSMGHATGKHTLMFVLLSFSLSTHSLKIKIKKNTLSTEEIAHQSDAEFRTLVIRVLTEMIEETYK